MRDSGLAVKQNYQVSWLELDTQPIKKLQIPNGEEIFLVRATEIPLWFFFAMYDAVGKNYLWEDMHLVPESETKQFLNDEQVCMFTMIRQGWPQGFFMHDTRVRGICEISYLGLVEAAIGKGLGGWLLDQAVTIGWQVNGVTKITVNTCTLDHANAMPLYLGRGFCVIRTENRQRTIPTVK